MIDHTGITVSDFARSLAFYEAALAPLGYTVLTRLDDAAGLGAGGGGRRAAGGGGGGGGGGGARPPRGGGGGGGPHPRPPRPAPAIPCRVLRGLCPRPRRLQHRGRVPRRLKRRPPLSPPQRRSGAPP
ncbi:hypothetical protein LWS69_21090, partial [Bordetella hinzii]|nr:hypothetical protein [Bordetella hinzii]